MIANALRPAARPPLTATVAAHIQAAFDAAFNAPPVDLGILTGDDPADDAHTPTTAQTGPGQPAPLNIWVDGACATGGQWTTIDGITHTKTSQVLECDPAGDHLFAALVRETVAVGRLVPDPVWRTDTDPLYRLEHRPPDMIFDTGFTPWGNVDGQYDLAAFVARNQPSPFVSTTYRDDLHHEWRKQSWRYTIDAPWGIDVNATIGTDHGFASQREVAFPGGIAPEFILGANHVGEDRSTLGPFIPNPNYRDWRR